MIRNRDADRWGKIRVDLIWLVYVLEVSQQVLATRLSVHQSTVSRWISGESVPKIPLTRIEACIAKYKQDAFSSWRYICSRSNRYPRNRREIATRALEKTIQVQRVHPDRYCPEEGEASALLGQIVVVTADLAGEAEAYVFSNVNHPGHFLILVEKTLSENDRLQALQTELMGHVFPLLGQKAEGRGSDVYGEWLLW